MTIDTDKIPGGYAVLWMHRRVNFEGLQLQPKQVVLALPSQGQRLLRLRFNGDLIGQPWALGPGEKPDVALQGVDVAAFMRCVDEKAVRAKNHA